MAIIRIKNLLIRTIIGLNPEERTNRQDVIINAEIEIDLTDPAYADEQDSLYDYKDITKAIIAYVEESKYKLLEKLTYEVLQLILKDNRVIRAKVEIDKPNALRYAESVSVELEANRSSL
jgi:D-erythro-7,8-dihydroneopterin triphosphate epimerase